jgi:hypothetical protein
VALAECCLVGGIGAEIEIGPEVLEAVVPAGAEDGEDAPEALMTALFGEGTGGFVVSGTAPALHALAAHVRVLELGTVGGEGLLLRDVRTDAGRGGASAAGRAGSGSAATTVLDLPLTQLADAHAALAELFE